MSSTNFLQWNPAAVNQENDAAYAADPQRAGGAVDNSPLPSLVGNKVFYQVTTFVAAFGQMMANKGYSTSDADIAVLTAVLANIVTDADQLAKLVTLGYSPTPVFNLAAATGFQMTLTGPVTSSSTTGTPQPGQLYAFLFIQDATGGRTVAPPANVFGFVQPDLAPNAVSIQIFIADAAGGLRAAGPVVSNNGTFTGALTAGSLTLSSPGTAGQVLTNVGGIFVPQTPSNPLGTRGTFTMPPQTCPAASGHPGNGQTYNTGIFVPSTAVIAWSVTTPSAINTIITFNVCVSGGQIVVYIGTTSSNTQNTDAITFNYVVL
jgi:hypothetical protein